MRARRVPRSATIASWSLSGRLRKVFDIGFDAYLATYLAVLSLLRIRVMSTMKLLPVTWCQALRSSSFGR